MAAAVAAEIVARVTVQNANPPAPHRGAVASLACAPPHRARSSASQSQMQDVLKQERDRAAVQVRLP